jgi:hypothetical protein
MLQTTFQQNGQIATEVHKASKTGPKDTSTERLPEVFFRQERGGGGADGDGDFDETARTQQQGRDAGRNAKPRTTKTNLEG